MSRRFALLVLLGALVVGGGTVGSRSAGGVDLPRAANPSCQKMGWITKIRGAASQPPRLTGVPKGCSECPGDNCSNVSKGQWLFANETMFTGGTKITFKSTVAGVKNLTCIVNSKSQNIIYPRQGHRPNERAVLRVVDGATSCQVEQGDVKNAQNATVYVNDTKLTVHDTIDPVFGIKAVGNGSLIQVKKGTISVGSKSVAVNQQVVDDGSAIGAVTPLKLDPVLRPGLCELTPELRLTDVKESSGARAGGNPVGLAPDRFGNLWFTDNATPAIGRYNMATQKITYPHNGGVAKDSKPTFIIADTKGEIWFTDSGPTPAIGRITPTRTGGTIVEYQLPPGSVPWNPAYDPKHNLVWFTDLRTTEPTGAIGALDPTKDPTDPEAITSYSQGLIHGSRPEGLVVDKRGNVWFTDDNGPRPAIGRLDAQTHGIEEYEAGLVKDSLPRGIAIDPNGNVWFADERTIDNSKENSPGDGLIGMISSTDPKHRIVEYAVLPNGGNRHSIPEGLVWHGGFVWFTDDGQTKAIGRIDPTTGAITESSKSLVADSQPIAIIAVKGDLWFTDRLKSAPKIGRLTARTC